MLKKWTVHFFVRKSFFASLIDAGIATNVRLARQDFTDELKLKSYEGLVEVEVNGTWGPILRHGIDDVTAKTICKILGNGYVNYET